MAATHTHSRFIDEVYCTPAPSAPQIDVKTVNDLRDAIFPLDADQQFREGLLAAEELKSRDLYEKYPPQFRDKNKQLIFNFLNEKEPYLPSSNKSILITRWKPFLPFIESDRSKKPSVDFQADVFQYKPTGDNQTVEWYLNFANSDLFAYYGSPLLAQDELQTLECTELCALREYFVQTTNTVGSRTVGSDAHTNKHVPTPILISNIERVINLDTKDIYGNAFAKATEDQLRGAFTSIKPPQTVNLIAIEAPRDGHGAYTQDQIRYILTTCYTGFKVAQILASKTQVLNTSDTSTNRRRPSRSSTNDFRTIIHTGWWGCGAYGNNRQMMLITQILAAHWAQIDGIVFHTQTNEHQNDIEKAKKLVEPLLHNNQVEEVIHEIVEMNLEWEKSNNT